LTTREKDTASRLLADLGDSFSRQIVTVQSDPNLDEEAKTSIIAQLRAEYEQNVKSVADIYGIEIDWGEAEDGGETPPGGGGEGRPEGIEPGPTSSKAAIAYIDRTPGAWKEYQKMKAINPKWTIDLWAKGNYESRKNEPGVYWGE